MSKLKSKLMIVRKSEASPLALRLYKQCLKDLEIEYDEVILDKTTKKYLGFLDNVSKKYFTIVTCGAEISRAVLKGLGYCVSRIKREYALGVICAVEQEPGDRYTTVAVIPVRDWNAIAMAGQAPLTEQLKFFHYAKEVNQTLLENYG